MLMDLWWLLTRQTVRTTVSAGVSVAPFLQPVHENEDAYLAPLPVGPQWTSGLNGIRRGVGEDECGLYEFVLQLCIFYDIANTPLLKPLML